MSQDCAYCHGSGMATYVEDSVAKCHYGPFVAPFQAHDKIEELCKAGNITLRRNAFEGYFCEVAGPCPCTKFNTNELPQPTEKQSNSIESLRTVFGEPPGEQFEGMNWESFKTIGDPEKEKAFLITRWFATHNESRKGKRGLLLWGLPSMGKTGLCYFLYQERRKDGAVWVDYNALIDYIQSTYGSKEHRDADQIMRRVANVPLLFLDDMGDIKRKTPISDDWRNKTYRILSRRHAKKLTTIITSNLDPIQMRYQMGDRITERINQLCAVIKIGGINLRDRQAQEQEKQAELFPAEDEERDMAS